MDTNQPGTIAVLDSRRDSRRERHPVIVNTEALAIAAALTGFELPEASLAIQLVDDEDCEGMSIASGYQAWAIRIGVKSQPTYAERHLYVLNNSLLYAMRTIANAQRGETTNADANFYARLADHTGTKDTGPAGVAMGQLVWGIEFS